MSVKRTQSFATTDAYVSGGTINHEFAPIPYTITRIDFEIVANVTTTGTPGTTQDWIWRLIRSLSLQSPLGTHIALQDLRPMHFENKYRWPGFHTGAAPGATQAGFVRRAYLRVDLGVNPADPFDVTGGIPAKTANLTLSGTWGQNASVGSGYTINAGSLLRTTFFGILPENDGEATPKGIPLISTVLPAIAQTTPSLGQGVNWPKAHFLHSFLVMPTLGVYPSDARSDSAISDVGIALPIMANQQRYYRQWSEFRNQERISGVFDDDGVVYGTPTVAPEAEIGVGFMPLWKMISGGSALYGADNRTAAEGDTQTLLGITNAANLNTYVLYRQYDMNPAAS